MTFAKAFLFTLCIGILWPLIGETIRPLITVDKPYRGFLMSIIPSLTIFCAVVLIEKARARDSWALTLSRLGFSQGNRKQFRIAFLGILPIFASFLIAFTVFGASSAIAPHLPVVILGFVISQGIVEETIFRGWFFRNFRQTHDFWQSALLSGVLFGVIHLANFANGFTADIALNVAISIVFGFVLAFPLAALFEVGGNSIAASGLLHIAIDAVNWFPAVTENTSSMIVCMLGVLVSAVLVTALARPKQTMS